MTTYLFKVKTEFLIEVDASNEQSALDAVKNCKDSWLLRQALDNDVEFDVVAATPIQLYA